MLRFGDRPDTFDYGALVDRRFREAIQALSAARRELNGDVAAAARAIAGCFQAGGTLLLCGNGGSAADAQHFAGEFVGRFKRPGRGGLPALALTADSSVVTAWANDCGFEDVFARQVEAFGRPGDVLVGISTSGRSRNVLRAFEAAAARGMTRIGLLGGTGGDLLPLAEHAIVAPSDDTQHIQEVHIVVIHVLCELVEEELQRLQGCDGVAPLAAGRVVGLVGRRR